MDNSVKLSVIGLSLLASIVLVPSVSADDTQTTIEVSANGVSSQNTVSVSDTNTLSVQQSNTAEVTTTVETKAETGNNTVDQNTGGNQTIVTGDASTSIAVSNEANQSTVHGACCENTTASITVANNGVGSENTVSNTSTTQTSVTTINSAKIVNNVTINANTGRNKVNYHSGGDTTMQTENIITESVEDVTTIKQDNFVNIVEMVYAECKKEKQKEKEEEKPVQPEKPIENVPNQPEKPTTTTSVGGPIGLPSANYSTTASQILPITGNNLLFFLLLANIMMFFLGTYLRLRSGRSPGYIFLSKRKSPLSRLFLCF